MFKLSMTKLIKMNMAFCKMDFSKPQIHIIIIKIFTLFHKRLDIAYHAIVRVWRYTLGIDTSNVYMIKNLHKTARTPFYFKMQFY